MLGQLGRATRNAHLWLPGYLLSRWRRRREASPTHVWMTVADHFEPLWGRPHAQVARSRVAAWRQEWPRIAARHQDSTGRPPQYCFFYPEEEYQPELVEPLGEMRRLGIADVEVHLHHDGDTEAAFRERVGRFLEALDRNHGLLRRHEGRLAFGFIHGNWALDNSLPDGRWCGLNNEITLLRELGCYADFTMPAAPSPAQGGPVNVVYRVSDDPQAPRSYAEGVVVRPGTGAVGDLTMIPGPLGVLFGPGRRGKPRLEVGELGSYARPTRKRVRLWLKVAPRIGSHVFLKLFTHGAQERHKDSLLSGGGLDELLEGLDTECRQRGTRLRYVTAWEMWRAVEALRLGAEP